MKYGLSEAQLAEINATLAKFPQVEKAVIFGSRAIDTFKEASDVDIAIFGDKVDRLSAATLKSELEDETYLPFFFDVVAFNTISSTELKQHITRQGKVIYRQGWREVRLGDFVKTNQKNIGIGYPYTEILYLDTGSITVNKITELQKFELKKAPSRAKRLVEHENIIYSCVRPNQLHYGFIKKPPLNLVVSTGFAVICNTNLSQLESLYLYYYLTQNSLTDFLHSIAEGSTSAYPSLKPSDIENLKIILPSLPEQKAIAEVLSSLDDKIDLLHRQNKTLETLAETLLKKLFFNEIQNLTLENICQVTGGYAFKSKDFTSEGTPVIKIKNILANKVNIVEKQFILNQESFDKKFKLYDGDIVMAMTGATIGKIGLVCTFEHNFFLLNQRVAVLRSRYQSLLWFLLNIIDLRANILNMSHGAAQSNISASNIANINIPNFNKKTAESINTLTKPMFKKIVVNQRQIKILENFRDTLLPKLIEGKLSISYV